MLPTICILLFVIPIAVLSTSELDCDFRGDCCWAGDTGWRIQEKHNFNINEFRRTFLVGRSRTPPAGNYLVRNSLHDQGQFLSCPICSGDGTVLVQFRHWQSPTARLRLCYKLKNQQSTKECQLATASKQSQLTSYLFRVPRSQKIQLVFLAETTEASAKSTVMIDGIKVQFVDCHSPQSNTIPPRPKKKHHLQSANSTIEETMSKRNQQLSEAISKKFQRQSSNGHFPMKKINKIAPKEMKAVLPPRATPAPKSLPVAMPLLPPAPAPKRPPIAIPTIPQNGKDFNPLNDLLGAPLANFLDPDYVTNDKDEPEEEVSKEEESTDEDLIQSKNEKHSPTHTITHPSSHAGPMPPPLSPPPTPHKPSIVIPRAPVHVNKPGFLSELQRPLPLGVPSACDTVGGCLFEQGFCSWKTPSDVPINAQFTRSRVGQSTFIQAKVPSGEVSIIQVDTQLKENHTVIFDGLEWQTGSRLIGCCFLNTNLHCPYSTPNEAGAVLWQLSKFECPAGTDKILFICENFGQDEAICGVDNVRLHRSTDIFFIEPCQKQLLSSL